MRFTGAVVAVIFIVELAALVAVAHAISWPLALLLLVALSVVGVELLRREGWAAFRGHRRSQSPERQLAGAAAGVIAAGLVAVPGFVTGVVGLIALTPPGRALFRRALAHRFAARITTAGAWQRSRSPRQDPNIVDSTIDLTAAGQDENGPVDLRKGRPSL